MKPLRSSASLLLCTLLIGFVASASAQPITPLLPSAFRSQITEEWNGNSWNGLSRTIQTFDDGNVVEIIVQRREGSAWVNAFRSTNTYDDNDRLEQVVSEIWSVQNSEWDNASRTTYTYDGSNITQILTENWNENASNWQNGSRRTNTYEDGNLTEVLVENWGSGSWIVFRQTINTYDDSDRIVVTITRQLGVNQTRLTNTYENGNLTRERTETWNVTEWVNSAQTLYEDFDANDFPETVTEQTWENADWENVARDLNTYDGMKLTQTVTQVPNGSDWDNDDRTTVIYSGNRIDEVIEETWDGSEWDNESRQAISYDGMDRVTMLLSQIWKGNDWENEGRIRYSYDDVLPVELTAFTVTNVDGTARLTWTTATETNNAGFEIERRAEADGDFTQIGFVEGRGTTSEPQQYRFSDDQVPFEADQVTYRLRQVDFDGAHAYSPLVELNLGAPQRFALHANYPNPFYSQTTIRYELPQAGPAQLVVYNVLGQQVAQLLRGNQPAGRGEVTLQSALPSGVYFLRLDADGKSQTRQITVVK